MSDTSEYVLGACEVGSLGWGLDEELEAPAWDDVATKLAEVARGEHEYVTLGLEPAIVPGEQPPTLFATREDGERLAIFFRSADHSLHTGPDSYSLEDAQRIFKRFFDQLELDPSEEWGAD